MEVIIDGVCYVPATQAAPDMEKIIRGLVWEFWGDTPKKTVDELMDGLSVRVYDDGDGDPIELVIANIARELGK